MTLTDLYSTPPLRVFTINAGDPFLPVLAATVLNTIGDDPIALSDAVILTPTRRAARGLGEALLSVDPKRKALLLPTLRPLGDIDEDNDGLLGLDQPDHPQDDAALPPAISPFQRIMTLARFVAARNKSFAGQENWPGALGAARELAKLLDSFYTEEIPFDRLKDAAPEALAQHWALSLEFLSIVTEAWPAYLDANGLMDPTARRTALIERQRQRWETTPPTHPVMIAGTTASAPAVARLVKTVAGLPKGAVILPGLDKDLDATGWEKIDDPHPQAGLKALLEKIDLAPQDIPALQGADHRARTERRQLLSLALRPADATDDWRDLSQQLAAEDKGLSKAVTGLSIVEAKNEDGEADAIAYFLREAIETPGKTAMLVTPDRTLARRVALKMRRWGVTLDDSAGTPFQHSPCGVYLRLLAAWRANPSDAVALLALARHPLARFGLSDDQRATALGALDEGLRGLTPTPPAPDESALSGIWRKFEAIARQGAQAKAAALKERAAPILSVLEKAIDTDRTARDFASHVTAHLTMAEIIAKDGRQTNADRGRDATVLPWRGADGEVAAKLFVQIERAGDALAASGFGENAKEYAEIFNALIMGAVVRHHQNHPRLTILGPLEARMQTADIVLLSGLNEGVWPAEAETDPFLSRPMRADVGLPSPERRLGLAAHDFSQLAAQSKVILTRAKERDGAPAKPSRWLVRLENILKGADASLASVKESQIPATAIARLDIEERPTPVGAPMPRPPVEARPRALYVTRIEKWLRDPYAVYAQHILSLRKLDDPGETFSKREMGSLLHDVFEKAARDGLPSDAPLADLQSRFANAAPDFGLTSADASLWAPSIKRAFDWFITFEQENRALGQPVVLEEKGELPLADLSPPFIIRAKADRIDQRHDGALMVFDYKSGEPPSAKQDKKFSPQLPLTALIAEQGGFPDVSAAPIAGYAYMRILNRREKSSENHRTLENKEASDAITDAAMRLRELIIAFDDPSTPYRSQPHPQFTDQFGDYDQLARRKEWGALGEGGDDA